MKLISDSSENRSDDESVCRKETTLTLYDPSSLDEESNVARHSVGLLIDNSQSLRGEPIAEVNRELKAFACDIRKDRLLSNSLLLSLVTYSKDENKPYDVLIPATEPCRFMPPTIAAETGTPQCRRFIEFLARLAFEQHTASRTQAFHRAWVFEFSDGLAGDSELKPQAKAAISKALEFGIEVYLFAVGPHADLDFLNSIAQPGRPAEPLPHGGWERFFSWLKKSVRRASQSQAGDDWEEDGPFGGKFRMGV